MAFRPDVTVDWARSPRIIWVAAPSTELIIQDLIDTLRTLEPLLDNLDDAHILNAAGKDDLGGGVYVGLTATLINAYVAFEARTTPLIGSTATADDPIWLYDATKDFIALGAEIGSVVHNETDRSCGTVLEVQQHAVRLNSLQGGTLNVWTTGDSYKLYNVARCEISGGNLVAVDLVGNPMDCTLPTANVSIVRTSSSSATLQELSAIQYASFNGGVTLDVAGGQAGTTYPIGTPESPVNNLTDAKTIATARGFSALYVIGTLALGATDVISGYRLVGEAPSKTIITAVDAAAAGSEFDAVTLSGNFSALVSNVINIRDCHLGNLSKFSGDIINCKLLGTLTVCSCTQTDLVSCYDGIPGSGAPVIDMVDAGLTGPVGIWGYNGGIKIRNLTTVLSNSVNMSAGRLVVEATCIAGSILVKGVGLCTVEAGVTTIVDVTGLISKSAVVDAIEAEIGPEIEYASYGNQVTVDVLGGVPGTAYPIGTLAMPVNSIIDAITIANTRGFNKIHIIGNATIGIGANADGFAFEGESNVRSVITIDAAALTLGCTFLNATVQGVLDGGTLIYNCRVLDLVYMEGVIQNSMMMGTIVPAGTSPTYLINCYSGSTTPPFTVDLSVTVQDFSFKTFAGEVRLLNLVNAQTIRLDLESGHVIIDSTCATGDIVFRGVTGITDNHTGTCIVDVSDVISPTSMTGFQESMVNIDVVGGVPGSAYPAGTILSPSNNLADLVVIAERLNTKNVNVIGALTLDRAMPGYRFLGATVISNDILDMNGQDVGSAYFRQLTLTGAGSLSTAINVQDSILLNTSGLHCIIDNCGLQGMMTLGAPGSAFLANRCAAVGSCILDCVGGGRMISAGIQGAFELRNVAAGSQVLITMDGGRITLAASCVGGTITVRGVGNLTDLSTGSVVTNELIGSERIDALPGQTWDEPIAGHLTPGSTGNALNSAGAGGDPAVIAAAVWSQPVGVPVAGSYGSYIKNKVLSVAKFLGLK